MQEGWLLQRSIHQEMDGIPFHQERVNHFP